MQLTRRFDERVVEHNNLLKATWGLHSDDRGLSRYVAEVAYDLLVNVDMLRDIAVRRKSEVDVVRLHTRLGLDEGHRSILDVEIIPLGAWVLDTIHAKRLQRR